MFFGRRQVDSRHDFGIRRINNFTVSNVIDVTPTIISSHFFILLGACGRIFITKKFPTSLSSSSVMITSYTSVCIAKFGVALVLPESTTASTTFALTSSALGPAAFAITFDSSCSDAGARPPSMTVLVKDETMFRAVNVVQCITPWNLGLPLCLWHVYSASYLHARSLTLVKWCSLVLLYSTAR